MKEPHLAVSSAGEAVAVWVRRADPTVVQAAVRSPGGEWGPPRQISLPTEDAGFPDVAVDAAGNAVAVWDRMDVPDSKYVVEAALHPAGGDWAPAVKLSRGERNAWEPSVAMDGAGNATAAWYSPDDKNNTIVQSATMKAGTPWDEPIDLSDPGADSFYPRVGAGGRGAVVLWEREGVIQAAALVDGDWQEPTDLSSSASKEASVDLDSQGNAIAVWKTPGTHSLGVIKARTMTAGGQWSEPVDLSPQWLAASNPQISVGPGGNATAVWSAYDGGEFGFIQSARRSVADGAWESAVNLSTLGVYAVEPQVASDPAGNAAVTWASKSTQAAIYDATEPELRSVSIPTRGRAGRPISFTASPFDAWSATGPLSWSFGDPSGVATGSNVDHSFPQAGRYAVTVRATDAAGNSTSSTNTIVVRPALAFANRLVWVRKGRARLNLRCPGTARCIGQVTLAARIGVRRGPRTPIGTASFRIGPDHGKIVPIELSRGGLGLLRDGAKLRARVTGRAVKPRAVTLKQAGGYQF